MLTGRYGSRTSYYSLNEAANIHDQLIQSRHEPQCPRCGNPLKGVEGGDGRTLFDVEACSYCGVSVMVELPALDRANLQGNHV